MNNDMPRNENEPVNGEPGGGRGAGTGEPRAGRGAGAGEPTGGRGEGLEEPMGGRGAGQPNVEPAVSQVENNSGGTVATDNNLDSGVSQPNETNNVTNTSDVTTRPSQTGRDTENPEGGESTGEQPAGIAEGGNTGEQSAGAEGLFSTPIRQLSRAGAVLINTPRRLLTGAINLMTSNVAAEQGNDDRGEGTAED